MQENKNLVEEALIQMKNVEEVIAENAKGILASTMKEEISQLVKESLSEQEELDVDTDVEDTEVDNDSMDSEEVELSMDDEDMDLPSDDDTPIDLTHVEDEEELLKVFKAMGEDDGIIVKKDGEDIHLKDNETDEEYLVKLGESEEENYEAMEYNEEVSDDKVQDVIDAIFSDEPMDSDMGSSMDSEDEMDVDDEVVYEIEFNEESDDEEDEEEEMDESEEEMDESEEEMDESEEEMDESEEEMDESEEEMDESEEEIDESEEDEGWHMNETYSHKKTKKKETKEGKMSVKPKGVGIGKPKFSYKKTSGGFKEDKKEGPKTMGTGKAKFEYKKGENMEGKSKVVKKVETKEASRTYGMGSKEGRGLRKGITPNRNLTFENLEQEVKMLREKNEEYRKALNVFREKLNEVAIFNSNLAYATRLFTEHSTTKKEKINILRRFDNVQSLKESKSLYKIVKDELNQTESKSLNETVENKLNQSVQTGSSTTLIENKTYENPQFLRIRDLITKVR